MGYTNFGTFEFANSIRFMGEISISVPERIPSSSNWSKGLIVSLQSHLNEGFCQFELPDNTEIRTYLQRHDNIEVSKEHVMQKASNLHIDHPYLAFISSQPRDSWVNMLYIRLASKNRDRILSDIFGEIKDAQKQFSESHAALIYCFIPEIDSFEHLREPDSGLALMTRKFFSDHAKDFIYGVLYISDEQADIIDSQVSSSYPTVIFRNPEYNEKYGIDIPLYRSHL